MISTAVCVCNVVGGIYNFILIILEALMVE